VEEAVGREVLNLGGHLFDSILVPVREREGGEERGGGEGRGVLDLGATRSRCFRRGENGEEGEERSTTDDAITDEICYRPSEERREKKKEWAKRERRIKFWES
jgi:hypothetical protein